MNLFGSAPDYAGLASKNEANRNGIINLGLRQLNAIFDGGSAPFFSQAGGVFDPKANYFSQSAHGANKGEFAPYWLGDKGKLGQSFKPGPGPDAGGIVFDLFRADNGNSFTGGPLGAAIDFFGGDEGPSPKDRAKASLRRGQLFNEQDQTFQGFQPSFYDQRSKDYVNYALPQLAGQYQTTKNALGFGVANRGLYGGSAAQKQNSELERETGQAKQSIADSGRNQANALQQQVAAAKQNAINQLYQTADPSQATAGAINAAAQFRLPNSFAPLANMFSSLLNQYQTSAALNPSGGAMPYLGAPQYSVTGAALPRQ